MVDRIKEQQKDDPEQMKLLKKAEEGKGQHFLLKDGVLWLQNQLCVPNIPKLRKELLKESHNLTLVTHPGSTKMYRDLKQHYWWISIKKDIADYVARCLTCQRIKTEHQIPGCLLQPLPIPV